MRLKSINKANSNTSNGLNSTRNPTNSDPSRNTYGNLSFNILNQDLSNIDENSFDLDMDSGEDEIDVGTHADSMLINYNNIQHSSDSFSSFPNNSHSSTASTLYASVNNSDHHFGINLNSQINSHEQALDNFAIPQHTATMSEADRKRAHHNALERKRRDHIKDSFHTLRDAIPNIKGEKVSTSRAQILKAATDYIKTMKNRNTVYQNDIDLIKKQNMEIENQIRQLEKSKLQNGTQGLNSNILIKSEQGHSLNHIQLNDNSDDNNDFKYDIADNNLHTTNSNMLHGNPTNVIKANNVLILTKPSVNGAAGTTKKFKTIVNPQKTTLLNNSNNFL